MAGAGEGAGSGGTLGHTQFLARAFQQGDRTRFEELFARVMPALFAWVRLRGRQGGTGSDANDITQEVWLRAFERFGTYDPAMSFRGWIFGIAKNVVLARGSATRASRELPLAKETAANVADLSSSIGCALSRTELVESLLASVERFDPTDRSLFIYCGLEELTCVQAASRIGISPDSATKRWQQLRARLRDNPRLRKGLESVEG